MSAPVIFTASLVGSVVIFLVHKVDGRFEQDVPAVCEPHGWHCEFPGLIVTHKPWSVGTGICVCIIYLVLAYASVRGLHCLAKRSLTSPASRAGLLAFSVFWLLWALYEQWCRWGLAPWCKDHHSSSSASPGSYYGHLFTQYVLFVYVPVTVWFLGGLSS